MTDVTFTEEQQAFVDKLVGDARVKAREKAVAEQEAQVTRDKAAAETAALIEQQKWQQLAEQSQARVAELEPLAEKAKRYEELVANQLEATLKELPEAAQKAVNELPEGMDATTKLEWLTKNKGLFQPKGDGVGTTKSVTTTPRKEPTTQGRLPGSKPLRL
jgi:hypothetical protein